VKLKQQQFNVVRENTAVQDHGTGDSEGIEVSLRIPCCANMIPAEEEEEEEGVVEWEVASTA
jgi:hypothetical protein